MSVIFGEHSRSIDNQYKRVVQVSSNVWHPDYDLTGNIEHDIAILTLSEELDFNDGVQPVCPPQVGLDFYEGQLATVSGWGARFTGGMFSSLQSYSVS